MCGVLDRNLPVFFYYFFMTFFGMGIFVCYNEQNKWQEVLGLNTRGLKIGLSVMVILMGAISFFSVGSRDMVMPVMMVALGALLLVRGLDYKRENDRSGFWLMTAAGLFIFAVVLAQFLM